MTFTKPTSFVTVPLDTLKFQTPASLTEFAAVLKEFLTAYMASGRVFSHLSRAKAASLGTSVTVASSPENLKNREENGWILVTPTARQNIRNEGPLALNISLDNSTAPCGIQPNPFLMTSLGAVPAQDAHTVLRTVMIAAALPTLFMSATLIDELSTAIAYLSRVLELELQYNMVTVDPVRRLSETEQPLFGDLKLDPLVFTVTGACFMFVKHKAGNAP